MTPVLWDVETETRNEIIHSWPASRDGAGTSHLGAQQEQGCDLGGHGVK